MQFQFVWFFCYVFRCVEMQQAFVNQIIEIVIECHENGVMYLVYIRVSEALLLPSIMASSVEITYIVRQDFTEFCIHISCGNSTLLPNVISYSQKLILNRALKNGRIFYNAGRLIWKKDVI